VVQTAPDRTKDFRKILNSLPLFDRCSTLSWLLQIKSRLQVSDRAFFLGLQISESALVQMKQKRSELKDD